MTPTSTSTKPASAAPSPSDMAAPDVSIIVVSYNTKDLTLACLESVLQQTRDCTFETIVVDNQSPDGSAAAIRGRFPHMRLIEPENNVGFARANNLAAEHATGRRLLLLNPDTLVLDNAIDRLVAFADAHPDRRIYGGRTLFGDRTLNPTSCWRRSSPWSEFCHATGLSAIFRRSRLFDPESLGSWRRDTERPVDIVTGCFLLIDRDLWSDLGGFDPAFFMYGEEADLCLRAHRRGAQPTICPNATIVHYGGKSEAHRAGKLVRMLTARRTLMQRHWPPTQSTFGGAMQRLNVLVRLTAWRMLALLGKRRARDASATFGEVWKRRGEWSKGFASAPESDANEAKPHKTKRKRVLAVASGGGHWVQMLRIAPAFDGHDVAFVTINPAYGSQVPRRRFYTILDATRWNKLRLLHMAWQILRILRIERPDVVISTGAAPGFIALRIAKFLGARTVWIDSIANVEQLSLSGKRIGKRADLWLTQWPHLQSDDGPQYRGAVL